MSDEPGSQTQTLLAEAMAQDRAQKAEMEAENRKMKEMIEKLERLDTNLEEMKISTLTAELACSKAEEDQLHRKFQADNEWGDYLRQVQEDQRPWIHTR